MKNFLLKLTIISLCQIPIVLFAKQYTPEKKPKIDYQQEALSHTILSQQTQPTNSDSLNSQKQKSKALVVTEASLLANPQLLQRTMESVLMQRNIAHIKVVLPIYKKSKYADPVLINYGEALVAHSEGNFKQAIGAYRSVLAKEPDLFPIRYGLATALYQNKQYGIALQQFEKLQATKKLPKSLQSSVASAIKSIKRQEEWQFYANFYFRKEDNINDAPKQRTLGKHFTFEKPEKATGIHLDLVVNKRINLANDYYLNPNASLNTDYFWDNQSYNYSVLRTGLGIGTQQANLAMEMEPFAKKTFAFGNKPYSTTAGVKTYIKYQFNPQFSLSNTTSLSYEKFDKRHHLDGQRQFTNFTAFYTPNAKQYWFAGVNAFNNEAKGDEDSFISKGAYIGWGQEWYKGISSKVLLSLNKKNHRGVDLFNIKREDKNYRADLSVWHRAVHFYGLTPKLVLSWDKTDSNHFYYDNKKEVKANIELSTYF